MKGLLVLCLCFLVVYVPQSESGRIIEKIKKFFHPKTTTTEPPTLPEYEKEEREEESTWLLSTSTSTWEGEYIDVGRTTTTNEGNQNSYYGNAEPTEKNLNYGGPTRPASSSLEEDNTFQSETTTTGIPHYGKYPGRQKNSTDSDNYLNQVQSTTNVITDHGAYPGSQQSSTDSGIYLNQVQSPTTVIPDHGAYPGSQQSSTDSDNYHNQVQSTTNVIPVHGAYPGSQQSYTESHNYHNQVQSTTNVILDHGAYPGSQQSSIDSDSYKNHTQSAQYDDQINSIIPASTLPTNSKDYHNSLSPNQPSTTPNYNLGYQGKPTTQPSQPLDSVDDSIMIFPDDPYLNPTPESQRDFTSGYHGHKSKPFQSTTARSVETNIIDSRRIIDGPEKDCGKGKKLDNNGQCRGVARK